MGMRLFVSVLVALACCGCAVKGQTASEMKHALQESFLYRSATAFADGTSGPFDATGRLTGAQKKVIVDQYQLLVKSLLALQVKHQAELQTAFPSMRQTRLKPRVVMSDSDLAAPRVNQQGEIFIDIRVARLMFRDAVLTSMKSGGLGAPGFMDGWTKYCDTRPASDAEYLNCFLRLKTRIDNIREQGVLGMLFDKDTWNMTDDAPWFLAADLGIQSTGLQARYSGVLMFLTAHELGHVLLGHLEAEQAGRLVTSGQRMAAERQADDFAVTLMALATSDLALFGGFSMFDFASIATGYDDFFRHTYANAQWSNAADSHPAPAERLRRATALHEEIRGRQMDVFWTALGRKMAGDPDLATGATP